MASPRFDRMDDKGKVFMFKKLIALLFGKKEEPSYAFSPTLKEVFPSSFTPLIALDYMRKLMHELNISGSETEIILLIAALDRPLRFFEIEDQMMHISDEHVAKLLRGLTNKGCLIKEMSVQKIAVYTLSEPVMTLIKSIHREW